MATAGDEKTGRYLGVQGYFLYGTPNWVYCYCQPCWKTQVLALPFVQELSQQLATFQQENASFQQAQATLQQEKTTLQQEKLALQQEKATLQQEKDANAAALQQLNSCLPKSRILDDLFAQSGADGLKTLLAGLSSDQIQVLRTHSQFDFTTFEQKLLQDQLTCAKATTSDAVCRLKMSVNNIVAANKADLLVKRQLHEKTVLNCTEAKMPEAVISEMMRVFNSHLAEVEASIETWEKFRTNLDSLEAEDIPEPPELHLRVIEDPPQVRMHRAE